MSINRPEITVIAPMFNEADNVLATTEAIDKELKKHKVPYEIIFVNDGSTDKSLQACESARRRFPSLRVVSYQPNRGRGKAIREGFQAARGRFIFTVDFDLSYDVTHISRMVNALKDDQGVDVVLVSCYMPGGKTIGVSPFRLFISRIGNFILRDAFPVRIYTSTCVVRGYRAEVIKGLPLESDDKEIHLEILSAVLSLGYKVKEIPGTLRKRTKGVSKFRFKMTSLSHVLFLLVERPAWHFWRFGLVFIGLSGISGILLLINRIWHLAVKYPFFDYISPALVILFFMTGLFSFFFGILSMLLADLRKQILRSQVTLNRSRET